MTQATKETPVQVLSVGLSCADYIWQVAQFPPAASRTQATAFVVQGGGQAATAAVTAARLGAYSELWAVHGDDAAADALEAELKGYGVETSRLKRFEGAKTFSSAVLVDPDGERYIFPYRGEGLRDTADGLELSRIASFDAVLVDGRHPIMSEAVLQAARQASVPSLGDLSYKHWHLAEAVDYLLISEETAAAVTGEANPERALPRLRQHPKQVVGITMGDEGFLFDDGLETLHVSALPVDVVDTSGAGDVFHGAFAVGIAKGWTTKRCALYASVTAALACTGLGRSAIPEGHEVAQLLELKTLKEMQEMRWT